MLTPVVEYDADASAGGGASCVRRHSVSEMTSCAEESGSVVESTTSAAETGSTSSLLKHSPASTTSGGCTGGWKKLFWVQRATQMHFECDSHDLNVVKMAETFFISGQEWI